MNVYDRKTRRIQSQVLRSRKVAQPDPWLALCESVGTTEEVFTTGLDSNVPAGTSRGEFKIKERGGRLFALIGSRWCRVERNADGRLVEIWTR
jgi:hypothetical protein